MPGISAVSPPISAQPARSQPAAMPLITRARGRDVELAARVVIEEEERLGAQREDVVHAHGDEIDADRIVAVELESELQFRAHAVGAGDQHRLPITFRHFEQRAEAADAGEHAGSHRALRVRLDPFDERIAGIDVDARVAIREGIWQSVQSIRKSRRRGVALLRYASDTW